MCCVCVCVCIRCVIFFLFYTKTRGIEVRAWGKSLRNLRRYVSPRTKGHYSMGYEKGGKGRRREEKGGEGRKEEDGLFFFSIGISLVQIKSSMNSGN